MSLSIEEVKKIAQLARIKLTPDEEKRYADTISVVLDYMKILNEVDTLLAQMPEVENNELVVPGVFENQADL